MFVDYADMTVALTIDGVSREAQISYEAGDDLKVRRAETGVDRMRGFAEFDYAARSWRRQRKVIARLEATTRGFDARYIVTSLEGEPRRLSG